MMKFISRIKTFRFPVYTVPGVLAVFGILAYGLFINRLGFYWDEFPMQWIGQVLGPEGLARYFSTNRPYWGLLYRLTIPLIGDEPLRWQVFGLFWRLMTAVSFWAVLKQVWRRSQWAPAFAAVLFLVYPGFRQQSTAMMYGHFFVVLTVLLLSWLLTLVAMRNRRWFWPLTVLSLALSFYNLMAMEYFFILELARPMLIVLALLNDPQGEPLHRQAQFKRALLLSLPYVALFIGAALWRAFFFTYQTTNYSFSIVQQLKSQPVMAVAFLLLHVFQDMGTTGLGAWLSSFHFPDPLVLGARSTLYYAVVIAASVIGGAVYLFLLKPGPEDPRLDRKGWPLQAAGAGLILLLLAGWPFWLTGTPIDLVFPLDRFTLPFMLGSSLLVTGLAGMLPWRRWAPALLVAVLAGFAVGAQFQTVIGYMRDWNTHKSFFWQLSWRIPALEPGSTVLTNELPLEYYTDNSLSAPLNWIYRADESGVEMPYILYYPTVRVGLGLPGLEKGLPIDQNYLATHFEGSTSQMVAVFYNRFTCLRVLDPAIEPENITLPAIMREAAGVSNLDVIVPTTAGADARPPADVYGAEPVHGWCYYFEKADLARQQGDWQQVAALGDQAFQLDDKPNDPMERVPFIEGYAHTGKLERAVELTREAAEITPLMNPVLCRVWQRIEGSAEGIAQAAAQMYAELECDR